MPAKMKRTIAETFARLASHTPIDKITVTDLVEECGISRQTFYYHFQDIMDVIEWSAREVTQAALDQSLSAKTPQDALRVFVSTAVEYRTLMLRLLRSQRRAEVERTALLAVRTYLETLMRSKLSSSALSFDQEDAAIRLYSYGLTGLLLEICAQDAVDIDATVKTLYRILPPLSQDSTTT